MAPLGMQRTVVPPRASSDAKSPIFVWFLGTVNRPNLHALRHAFGTHAVRSGGNIAAIRELMGHKDLETTTRYLHAVADDKRSVIRMFDGQLRGNE
ncbi:MAG: tyrosine-type recombinase/integrase [Polyangiaceae bacterium]